MKKVIFMACAVALAATVQAKSMDNAKLSINKNNIKVWTYQDEKNPVFQYKAETSFDVPLEKVVYPQSMAKSGFVFEDDAVLFKGLCPECAKNN